VVVCIYIYIYGVPIMECVPLIGVPNGVYYCMEGGSIVHIGVSRITSLM